MSGSRGRVRLVAVLLLSVVLTSAGAAAAATWPDHAEHWVNDYAGLLPAGERESLDARLREYEARTTNQIVVAIFSSLEGEDRDDLTNRLFERWRIGKKGKDNGVLLTVFVKDRKMRIEVGYGFEAQLTDAISSRILNDALTPAFREGRYGEGISAALDAIIATISGEASPARPRARRSLSAPRIPFAVLIVMIILFGGGLRMLALLLGGSVTAGRGGLYRHRRRGIFWGGGGWGGGGFGGGGGWGGGGGGGFSGGGGSSGGGGAGGGW